MAWHLGASQSDLAFLTAENVDWDNHVISGCARMKTGTVAIMRFDEEVAEILRDLPGNGPLFPYLRTVRAGDRATEFKQRCNGLKIKGVSLHCYRYAWAERVKTAGYPEPFAMENLGQKQQGRSPGLFAGRPKVEIAVAGRIRTAAQRGQGHCGFEPVAAGHHRVRGGHHAIVANQSVEAGRNPSWMT